MLYPTQIRWVENHKYLLTLLADCSCGSAPGPDPHCWAQRVPMAATHPFLGPSWGQRLSSAPQGRAAALCHFQHTQSLHLLESPSLQHRAWSRADVAGGNAESHPRLRTGGGDGAACTRPQINASTKSVHICLLLLIQFCSNFCFGPIKPSPSLPVPATTAQGRHEPTPRVQRSTMPPKNNSSTPCSHSLKQQQRLQEGYF